MSTRRLVSLILFVAVVGLVALPATAEAQRRGPRGRGHSSVVVSVGVGYPGPWYYDQWRYPYGPWGPWGPWGPYPRYYVVDEYSASVRIDVEPSHAEVYLDGYYAGIVDNFDGIFQSLRMKPGQHEITIYLSGYRTLVERLYVEPYQNRKIRLSMERLGPGESSGPPPMPPEEPPAQRYEPERPRPPQRGEPAPRPAPAEFGTLSLRVQPPDAEILVDGERWTSPVGSERITVQLTVGRHRLEVRKEGMATYSEEILIRSGATLTLNVALR